MLKLDRIVNDPAVFDGQSSIRGAVKVSTIVSMVGRGSTITEVADQIPGLDEEDIRQALIHNARQLAQWVL